MSAHRALATLARCALLVGLSAGAPGGSLFAQSAVGTVQASTEILLPPVTGTGLQDLSFGDVMPGASVNVPPLLAAPGALTSSAGWHFGNIHKNRWGTIRLTLPATLVRGTRSIPINWNNANYGLVCVRGPSGVCQVNLAFNPGTHPDISFYMPPSMPGGIFEVHLFVGASITVPAILPPGVYTARVTASFAYGL
jgi:hypothetical protein